MAAITTLACTASPTCSIRSPRTAPSGLSARVLLSPLQPALRSRSKSHQSSRRQVQVDASRRTGTWSQCNPYGAWSVRSGSTNEVLQQIAKDFGFQPANGSTSAVRPLSVDIEEDTDSYRIIIDLPGVKREDLQVRVSKQRVLSITAERKLPMSDRKDDAESTRRWRRQERPQGRFERKLELPENADSTSVTAKVELGVLTLNIWKTQHDEPDFQDVVIS